MWRWRWLLVEAEIRGEVSWSVDWNVLIVLILSLVLEVPTIPVILLITVPHPDFISFFCKQDLKSLKITLYFLTAAASQLLMFNVLLRVVWLCGAVK